MSMNVPFTVRLKTCLRMCVQRLRYAQEKQQALAKQDRRHVATLLSQNKEQMAYFRVESLITNDIHVELLEILELYCELLLARINIVNSIDNELDLVSNHIEDGINEAVRALVYSSVLYVPEVKEMAQLRDLIMFKFGKEFILGVQDDKTGVPEKVVKKCIPDLPPEPLVVMYLQEIAKTYEVPYTKLLESDSDVNENEKVEEDEYESSITPCTENQSCSPDDKPIVAIDPDASYENVNEQHPITVKKPRMTSDDPKKNLKISKDIKDEIKFVHPTATKNTAKHKTTETDIDDLKKRFAALRR
ncbi:vacuolar protein sorting-associated protein Ist1p [Monosporozyma servazzii]